MGAQHLGSCREIAGCCVSVITYKAGTLRSAGGLGPPHQVVVRIMRELDVTGRERRAGELCPRPQVILGGDPRAALRSGWGQGGLHRQPVLVLMGTYHLLAPQPWHSGHPALFSKAKASLFPILCDAPPPPSQL